MTAAHGAAHRGAGCTVLKARRIYDLGDPGGAWFRSLAYRDGRVVAASTEADELDGLAASGGQVRDAGDLTFIPGYFDSHIHFLWAGLDELRSIVIDDVSTVGEYVAAVAARPSWPTPWPSRSRRRADGRPNGQFHGPGAMHLITSRLPPDTTEHRIAAIEHMGTELARFWVTSIRDVGVQRPEMVAFHLAHRAGRLPVRAHVLLRLDPRLSVEEKVAELDAWPVSSGFGDDRLRVGAAMLVADQAIDGAATSTPHGTDAAEPASRGMLYASDDEVSAVVDAAVDRGWRVSCSAAGDRAVEQILATYERVNVARPDLPAGWLCIEHALLATPAQRRRCERRASQ